MKEYEVTDMPGRTHRIKADEVKDAGPNKIIFITDGGITAIFFNPIYIKEYQIGE